MFRRTRGENTRCRGEEAGGPAAHRSAMAPPYTHPSALRRSPRHSRPEGAPGERLRAAALVAGACLAAIPAAAEPLRWSLSDALNQAFAHSPALAGARAALEEVEARQVVAGTYPHNPVLSIEWADRSGPLSSSRDRGLELAQELELAGQRGKRLAVAGEDLAAAAADWRVDQQRLAFRVETAFVHALHAREVLRVAQADAQLAVEVLDYSERRLERGAATQIELNLARASAGRARRGVEKAFAAYRASRGRLAELAGLAPSAEPEPLGELTPPKRAREELADLLSVAFAERAELAAAERQVKAAEAEVRFARAEGRPNLTVGGFARREESDDIVGVGLGLSLPLFDRNRGGVAAAQAAHDRQRFAARALRLVVEREVHAAWAELEAARAAADHLEDQVLSTLEDNVQLLQGSFAAGRIGAVELVALRREFVAARREYLDASAEVWLARATLDLAVGRYPIPTPPGPPTAAATKEMP